MRRGNGVEDEVELVGIFGHLLGVTGDTDFVGTQAFGISDFASRGRKQDDVGAHGVGDLDAHVP